MHVQAQGHQRNARNHDKGFRDSVFFEPYKKLSTSAASTPGGVCAVHQGQSSAHRQAARWPNLRVVRPARDGGNGDEPGHMVNAQKAPASAKSIRLSSTSGWPLADRPNIHLLTRALTAAPSYRRSFRQIKNLRSSGSTRTGAISTLPSSRNSSASIAIPSATT